MSDPAVPPASPDPAPAPPGRVAALFSAAVALALLLLGSYAGAVALGAASCPAHGAHLTCAALVRPALSSLGPLPIVPILIAGALIEGLAALLLLARGPRLPFARDAAVVAALGAGFALGLQPLGLLVARGFCPLCLGAVLLQGLLALGFAAQARASRARALTPCAVAFLGALLITGGVAIRQGLAQRATDGDAARALEAARVPLEQARLVLVEQPGCPYCEALALDVLASPALLPRVTRAGLARVAPGSPGFESELATPILFGRSRDGQTLRVAGFDPDPEAYAALLAAAER